MILLLSSAPMLEYEDIKNIVRKSVRRYVGNPALAKKISNRVEFLLQKKVVGSSVVKKNKKQRITREYHLIDGKPELIGYTHEFEVVQPEELVDSVVSDIAKNMSKTRDSLRKAKKVNRERGHLSKEVYKDFKKWGWM